MKTIEQILEETPDPQMREIKEGFELKDYILLLLFLICVILLIN